MRLKNGGVFWGEVYEKIENMLREGKMKFDEIEVPEELGKD